MKSFIMITLSFGSLVTASGRLRRDRATTEVMDGLFRHWRRVSEPMKPVAPLSITSWLDSDLYRMEIIVKQSEQLLSDSLAAEMMDWMRDEAESALMSLPQFVNTRARPHRRCFKIGFCVKVACSLLHAEARRRLEMDSRLFQAGKFLARQLNVRATARQARTAETPK